MSEKEQVHIRKGAGPCEVHAWTDEMFLRLLIPLMRARHGHGGVNACTDCLRRAKAAAAPKEKR